MLDASQLKGLKRKPLDAPERQQSFETRHYHTSSATIIDDESIGGEAAEERSGRWLKDHNNPQRRNGQNGDGYSSRSEKRLKLKSSVTSGTEQYSNSGGGRGRGNKEDEEGERIMTNLSKSATKVQNRREDGKSTRGLPEDKKGKAIRALNDESKEELEGQDRWQGASHGYLGEEDFDNKSRMTHRREKESEHRTNGQHCKDRPDEDAPGITQKTKVDFRHSSKSFHKANHPTLTNRDRNLQRDGLIQGRGTITKSRSEEDSKFRRDAPKRCREEVDFCEGHDAIRGDKRMPREERSSYRFRSAEFEEENYEGRLDKQVIGEEEDRKYRESSGRHGRQSRHDWKMKNGNKSHQHEDDGFTKQTRAERRFQFYRTSKTIHKPRSFKRHVEHHGHSAANSNKPNAARGIAYTHWQDDQYDQTVGHKSGKTAAAHDTSLLPRNQRKLEKTSTAKETDIRSGLEVVLKNSEDQKSSKDNSSRGTRGTDDQDGHGGTDQNGGKEQRVVGKEARKLEICSQRSSSTLDDSMIRLPDLEAAKIFGEEEHSGAFGGSRSQMVVEVDHGGPENTTEDTLHQSTSNSPIPERRNRNKCIETSEEGSEKTNGTGGPKSDNSLVLQGQECKSIVKKMAKDGLHQIEGTAEQQNLLCSNSHVQEQRRSRSRTPRKSAGEEALQQLKPPAKVSMKKKKKSPDDSLLRRQVVNADRPYKHDVKSSSRDHKRQKRRGRSYSASPNYKHKHTHVFSPKTLYGNKSTSPPGRSSERHHYRSDWHKFDRERRKTHVAPFDSRYRRFGGGTSGLGGYSPRRRRSEAAVKTPSPPPTRSPSERKKEKAWDSAPPGLDSSMIAAISAAHQAAVQNALAITLATTVNPLVPSKNILISENSGAHSLLSSLQQQAPQLLNPAAVTTAVTLSQATRSLRRLYVGNVPSTISDGELMEFMNAAMVSANANHLPGTKPCINCSVNMEKNHAFAEFITPEDATAALSFDGVTLHGTTLKIRRPKDFVQPANGGIESILAVPDVVSSHVADSPHKVFVGGIPSSLTADKVKEIVTAFGQLKAYHWEVDNKQQPPQALAFLEYKDPRATMAACAGLNGMRLGTGFLTVVQATPDANNKSASKLAPFYGIPEHAKSLLEPPSCVLELHHLVAAQDVPNMSKEDVEELIEDVRLECIRFGNVKSTHMIHHRSNPEPEIGNIPRLCIIEGAAAETSRGDHLDCTNVQESSKENISQENTNLELAETVKEMSSDPARLQRGICLETDETQMLATGPADSLHVGNSCKESGKSIEENSCHLHEFSARDMGIASPQNVVGVLSSELQASTSASQMDNIIPSDEHKLHVQIQDISGLTTGSSQEDVSTREWENSHLGKVFVEFSTEESACQAAHALHGRLFDGHKVAVSYFPLKLYQERFLKGPTLDEKQALALAPNGQLAAQVKD
ncbi:unnamed protein product [Calypogeia fissa]